jgi:hypothetical protein
MNKYLAHRILSNLERIALYRGDRKKALELSKAATKVSRWN